MRPVTQTVGAPPRPPIDDADELGEWALLEHGPRGACDRHHVNTHAGHRIRIPLIRGGHCSVLPPCLCAVSLRELREHPLGFVDLGGEWTFQVGEGVGDGILDSLRVFIRSSLITERFYVKQREFGIVIACLTRKLRTGLASRGDRVPRGHAVEPFVEDAGLLVIGLQLAQKQRRIWL